MTIATSNPTERPIVFNTQEVIAVLSGCKTQHRVSVLTAKEIDEGFEWDFSAEGDSAVCIKEIDDERQEVLLKPCPFGAIGDRLWVQEFHARREFNDPLIRTHYYADGPLSLDLRHDAGLLIKCSAEDMPRWASRILLEITDIRIERVQRITGKDVFAEGCNRKDMSWHDIHSSGCTLTNAFNWFKGYWNEKHSKLENWESNPWVWVIEFK